MYANHWNRCTPITTTYLDICTGLPQPLNCNIVSCLAYHNWARCCMDHKQESWIASPDIRLGGKPLMKPDIMILPSVFAQSHMHTVPDCQWLYRLHCEHHEQKDKCCGASEYGHRGKANASSDLRFGAVRRADAA